jgi:hypothetical protein
MVSPVDFDRTVEYWQQDRWTGCFSVKWRIIKDIPNNVLRHITLENNENKPVTNSRDTQEVFTQAFFRFPLTPHSFQQTMLNYMLLCRSSLRKVLKFSKFSRSIQAKPASWMILHFTRLAKRQFRRKKLRNNCQKRWYAPLQLLISFILTHLN